MVSLGCPICLRLTLTFALSVYGFRVGNAKRLFKTEAVQQNVFKQMGSNNSHSPVEQQKKVICPVRMMAPYEGFKYPYEVDQCFQCKVFKAMEKMPQEVMFGVPCQGKADRNPVCKRVSETRDWNRFCACLTLKQSKTGGKSQPSVAIAFPGVAHNGKPCGPQSCWNFLTDLQERRARQLGSSLTFAHNAIDDVKLARDCASCSSGALPPEQQADCTARKLGLGDTGGVTAFIDEGNDWVTSSELNEVDSDEEQDLLAEMSSFEAQARKGKQKEPVPAKSTHEVSVGTNISETVEESTQTGPMPPSEEELLKKMLEEQKKLYEDLLVQLKLELNQARQDITTQAEFANSHCFTLISGLKQQLKENEAASWKKERQRLVDSHTAQIQILTTNLAATGKAETTALEAQFNKLLLEARSACEGEKQALTEQLEDKCQASISATELRIKTESDASCKEQILLKIKANDAEWQKKELIWIQANQVLEDQAVDAKAKQAVAEEQWRKINEEKLLEVTTRRKYEELLKTEREAWARERKALEDQVAIAQRNALAQQNMATRAKETCDDEKKQIQSDCQISLNGFRETCEKHIKLCMEQKQSTTDAVAQAEERCNQQITVIQQNIQHTTFNISQSFETRWAIEVKRQEANCAAEKQEQYRQLERQCGDIVQQSVAKARTEESDKCQSQLIVARESWKEECVNMAETQKEAWLAQLRIEHTQKIGQMQQECTVQIDAQMTVQAQLQQQIQTIYAAGMQEHNRAEQCIVQAQSDIQKAEERVSMCQSQGNQLIVQFKATLQESQTQCDNSRSAAIADLTQKHQQEMQQLQLANQQCLEKLANEGRLTEMINTKHQESIQQINSLTVQLSAANDKVEDCVNQATVRINSLEMDLTQKTSLVATCNQELINLRSAAKSAVTDCQSELGECRQQAEAALLEQKRTAKEEIEALEQRYLAAFKQHQDLFNQEAAKNQKCQEQITIVNRQSTELTVQYKSAIDSCISECNGALQNQLQTSQNTYTKEKQEMTAQYIQIKTQLETQLSDCVSGLSEHNATAKQQLLAFQQQVKEARLQVTNMEERVSQCMTEGNRLFQEYEAYKGDCSRKEAAAMDMKNQCQSAVNQLQQSKQDAENQLAQCTEQLRGAMQMMEQPQNAGPLSNELPFCNICVQYCTSGDVRLKVYKGGWFLPGHQSLPFSSPDKRAPAGGCVCCLAPGYLPVKERAYLQISAKSDAA